MSEKNDEIIDSIDVFYEKLGKGDGKALILLSIQNWLYNIIKFDEINGDEVYLSIDEMLYKTQYNIDNFKCNKTNDFLSMIIDYVENASYYLIQNLNSSIVRQYEYIHFGQVKEIDIKSIQKLAQKPGRNTKQKLASDPRIYAVKKQFSYNIVENRVLKVFLHTLKTFLDMKISALGNNIENKENIFFEIINSFLQSSNALSIGDYKTIKINNVLLRDKHYKKIWKSWSRLKDLDYIINKSNHFLDGNIIIYMYYSIISMLSRTDDYYIIQSSFQLEYDKISEENIHTKDINVFKKYDNKVIDLKIKNNILIYNNENSEVIVGIKNNVITVVKNMLTDEIIELRNQNIKKEYSIITKTYEITNDNINNLIKELYYFITGFDNFNRDVVLEPLDNKEQKEVFIDICSNKPEYYFNNENHIIPFRLLIQKQKDDMVVDCKISKAVSKENTPFDMVELLYKNDKDKFLEFNGKEIFFKNIKDYLQTEKLVYLLPDTLDTIKIFETKHIISYINFLFNFSIRLPRSIAAVLGEKLEDNKVYYFIDFVYGCPYITKIKSIYNKELEKFLPETKGICFERHYTKEIKELQDKYYYHYNDLTVYDNGEIILPQEKYVNKIDYNIVKKYILEDNKKDFVILYNNIKLENTGNIIIKETNINKMLVNCKKFYDLYSKIKEYNNIKEKNISIWYDYLPQLALTCISSKGYYYNFELIGKDSKINPYDSMKNFPIKDTFILPANDKNIKFPLLIGNNLTHYEASIKLNSPFEKEVECRLELTYSYGKEEPYQLYFIPKDNNYNKLEVEWKEAKIENKVPKYPQMQPWNKLVDYPNEKYGSKTNLLDRLIKHLNNPKKNMHDEKIRKTIRFDCYRIWENGKSIYDRECPAYFREKIKEFIQKYDNKKFSGEFFDFITSIMHKDMPKTAVEKVRENLHKTLSLSEDIGHKIYTSIGYALGDISQDWQKDILREISNIDIRTTNQYVRRALLRIISIAIWNTEYAHRVIYSIFSENNNSFLKLLITENIIYNEIEKEFHDIDNKIQNKIEDKDDFRQLLKMYDLLFGLMLYKDEDNFPDLKNILNPTSEIIAKYIKQLDEIWQMVITKCDNYNSESLNSFIKFDIQNMPKDFEDKKVPKIFFAVRSYLTGNFNGSTISIKEFMN